MRVKPSALTAILAIVGYLVVVFTVWGFSGLKYDEVGDTVDNVRTGVTLAIGLGAIYLVVVTTAFGWWRPAIGEPRRVGSWWMWVIPVCLLAGAAVNLVATEWSEIDGVGTYVFWLAVGCAFVGFSEELLTRGLAIVGGRGSMHERWVWAFSGVIFGLLHLPNAFFGQSVGSTASQMVFAFAVGMTYYVTRRISGTLIVTMVLHATWDFSVFIQGRSVKFLDPKPTAFGGYFLYIAVIVGVFALVKILKTGDVVDPHGDQPAELAGSAEPATVA